jgi:predicted secreted protein
MRFRHPSRFSFFFSIGLVVVVQITVAGTVTLTKKNQGETVEVSVGDVIQIELSGTPTTGYWWHFDPLDSQYVEVVKRDIVHSPNKTLEGAPATGIWHLKAKRPGLIKIEASYARSWEKHIPALAEFRIILKIH